MKKILFPIDGSEYSQTTVKWACRFLQGQQQEIRIYLLIVAESLDIDYTISGMVDILDKAKTQFESTGFHVEETAYRINQRAEEAIQNFADEHEVSQIVIGTHGKQLARLLIGSVSQSVLKNAKQPVLVLNNLRALTPERYSSPNESLKLIIPVNRPDSVSCVLKCMRPLLSASLEIHLLHVIAEAKTPSSIDAESLLKENAHLLAAQGFALPATALLQGEPAKVIGEYVETHDIDEIILPVSNRTSFEKLMQGSVSQGILQQAKHPVLYCQDKQA